MAILTPEKTLKEIDCQEFEMIILDLLKNPEVQKMKEFVQHCDTSCYEHCIKVAYYTYSFCKRFHLDYISATRGAMLHDLFLYDWHKPHKKCKRFSQLHAFAHPKIALKNATELFDLNAMEKDVIVKHMWPVTISFPSYKESLVVTFADKYSALSESFNYYTNLLHKKRLYKYAYVFLSLIIFRIV